MVLRLFTSPFTLEAGHPNGGTIYAMEIGRHYKLEIDLLFCWPSGLNGMEKISNSEDWKQKCVEASVKIERSFGLMTGLYESEKQYNSRSRIRFHDSKLTGKIINALSYNSQL